MSCDAFISKYFHIDVEQSDRMVAGGKGTIVIAPLKPMPAFDGFPLDLCAFQSMMNTPPMSFEELGADGFEEEHVIFDKESSAQFTLDCESARKSGEENCNEMECSPKFDACTGMDK